MRREHKREDIVLEDLWIPYDIPTRKDFADMDDEELIMKYGQHRMRVVETTHTDEPHENQKSVKLLSFIADEMKDRELVSEGWDGHLVGPELNPFEESE